MSVYLTSYDVRELLGITRQALEHRIRCGQYVVRKISSPKGGRSRYEISLDSLPLDVQQRYWQQVKLAQEVAQAKPRRGRPTKAAQAAKAEAEAREAAEVQANIIYSEAPRWQKDIVDHRLQVVQDTIGMTRSELEAYIESRGLDLSAASIYRWRKAYAEGGKNALMTAYGKSKGQSIIPDEVFAVFRSVYMSESRPSTQAAYIAALGFWSQKAQENGAKIDKFPCLATFEYRLKNESDESARYYARYGEAAWNRRYGRSVARDYTQITCGECAVGDHMQLDVLCLLPDGSTCRPWLTAWTDFKSRKMLGWDLHAEAPNSDHIFTSFRAMVRDFGLPKYIYIDNGKDYRSRDFAGGRKLDEARTSSLMADLGVEVHFALPYNAQAKNIERRFRDFHNYCERILVGYTGTNVTKRPEALKRQQKSGRLLTFAEVEEIVTKFINETLNRMPFGRGAIFAAACPDQVWAKDNPTLRRVSAESLSVFCQRSSRVVTIGRNGIKDPDLDATYWAEEFVTLKGRKVYLRRDIHDYADAWIYDAADDRLLCRARLAEAIHPLAADEVSRAELKARTAEKRRERKATKKAAQAQEIAASEKMQLLQAGIAAINAERGWQPEPQSNVIKIQPTPLDARVREMNQIRREATTNSVVVPVLTRPQERKIYLSRTEMELDMEAQN